MYTIFKIERSKIMKDQTFAERLGLSLEKAAYSRTQFSHEIGITRSAVSHWLSGLRIPTPAKIVAIASLLNVPYEWLKLGDISGKSITNEFDGARYYPETMDIIDVHTKRDTHINKNVIFKKLPKGRFAIIHIFEAKDRTPFAVCLAN
jgi:transcriptional regulator with XRE-family HTH domain